VIGGAGMVLAGISGVGRPWRGLPCGVDDPRPDHLTGAGVGDVVLSVRYQSAIQPAAAGPPLNGLLDRGSTYAGMRVSAAPGTRQAAGIM
jgi:hypothetical protein